MTLLIDIVKLTVKYYHKLKTGLHDEETVSFRTSKTIWIL